MSSSFNKFSDEICAQRKSNGDPRQSPALRGEKFCHFHKVMGTPKTNIDNGPSSHAYLPVFEDAVAIQLAISDVCEMMLHRRIEPKEAAILLYAMQVASANMVHMNGEKSLRKHKSPKKSSAEPNSSVAQSSQEASMEALTKDSSANDSSATSSSAPEPLPPGTIHACEQRARQA